MRSSDDLAGGRLLVYHADEQLADGASEDESAGFFDVEDAPPTDTWVALFRDEHAWDRVVTWVPPAFVQLVEAGMSVDAIDSIRWLSGSDLSIAAELRGRGLLTRGGS